MLRAVWTPYRLYFTFTARTSRAVMHVKDTYFIKVWDTERPGVCGVGECNLFQGLSADDVPEYEALLSQACRSGLTEVPECSSIIFGVETAMADLAIGGRRLLWPSAWTDGETGIDINGLIWMGDKREMLDRIKQKLDDGYKCLKLKIGGIRFEDELDLIRYIRRAFLADVLELRLDANGAFAPTNALSRLEMLAPMRIHSIEQPIKAEQPEAMAIICQDSPIAIALDEELIGVRSEAEKRQLLELIKPQYIILKPALCGGFAHADQWIEQASRLGIGWWATSALESNVGLNAIAQWVAQKPISMPQGLGTGRLYSNNIASPMRLEGDKLWTDPAGKWDLSAIDFDVK